MSGALRRLVGRALGLRPTVHSSARLPYAPPPALIEAADATAPSATSRGTGAIAGLPAAPGRRDAGDPGWLAPGAAGVPEPPPVAATGHESAAEPPPHLGNAVAEEKRSAFPEPVPPAARWRFPATSEGFPEALADWVPEPLVPDPRAQISGGSRDHASRAAEPIPAEFAEARLPSRPTPRPPAWNPDRRSPESARRPAAAQGPEAATEVHVTIGRIEVTAVHEAPPPTRARAPAPKSMSLEEYLARRRGGRP